MKGYMYWILLIIFSIIHVDKLTKLLPWKVPILFTITAIIIFMYFISKKTMLHISELGVPWNLIIWMNQLLLVTIYVLLKPSFICIIPFIIFIGLESFRIIFSHKLSLLTRENIVLKEEISHFNETFRVVRSERHDFLKHVSAMHFMLENDKFAEVKHYLNELVDGYEETNLSIKGERGIVAGNLHDMYQRAKKVGIEVIYDFDLPLNLILI